MKKILILFTIAVLAFTGCDSALSPTHSPMAVVAADTENTSATTTGSTQTIDTSMFDAADIAYIDGLYNSGDVDTLQDVYDEACILTPNDTQYLTYIQTKLTALRNNSPSASSMSINSSARSVAGVTADTSVHYFNGKRVTSGAWKQFIYQFTRYSGTKYASEYGDLMEFLVERPELYFVYGFNTGNSTIDTAWDATSYQTTIDQMMSVNTMSPGDIPNYGDPTPPTCGVIIGADTTGLDGNGVMFLLSSESHVNWGRGYCYSAHGYDSTKDGWHTGCYIPLHIVFYEDGVHIRQACYVSYEVVLPESEYCTACFKEKSSAIVNLPYSRGDWTYETEYGPRSVQSHIPSLNHQLISGVFTKR